MKKKLLAVMLIVVMVLASAVTAFAADDAKITIPNAAKGETYTAYRIFDVASYNSNGGVVYKPLLGKGIPDVFQNILEVNSEGEIVYKVSEGTGDNEGKFMFNGTAYATREEAEGAAATAFATAVENWAKPGTDAQGKETESPAATWAKANGVALPAQKANGKALEFKGIPHGYYVITSTQGNAASIISTDGEEDKIFDKNSKTIQVDKKVDEHTWSIGDTITYTAEFDTVNYLGEGENSKQVIEYEVKDTLPPFLTDVTLVSVSVGGETLTKGPDYTDNFTYKNGTSGKSIIVPWAKKISDDPKEYENLYSNGAKMVVVYTAVLTDVTNINKNDINTVSLHPTTWDGKKEEKPWDEKWQDDEYICTYAAALKKVDEAGKVLDGAKFTVKGLVAKKISDGVYEVVSYDRDANTTVVSDKLETKDGMLYIVGLDEDVTLTVTETQAPAGYNKLTAPFTIQAQNMGTTQIFHKEGYAKYDAKGNLIEYKETVTEGLTQLPEVNLDKLEPGAFNVVNRQGTEMPSTGGMGTTILYTLGGILVVGAGVLLVARRKMDN